ncbi:hypothetical protein UFOVP967_95 [uncultured Caudovirales phage]|uniref:SWIM-type domain-containing protein n=1 Tax=uncultured Caudovirales phage TaxID=2100421 RepID=A0A6J5SRR2_9CAUD|nr:hypothetical protein UFOVP521_21 [uncultured Caudovirales phage]CAB4168034.1 hypothetical protein UFOVP856_94 [uncultured Caudovirales phage]CAB4174907.1 hypothetical protein UFOVP967_95 [uncultured Caudovirales phage]CAB4180707.1 hypothetical protein UFOVP1036_87 [uncultured Caudovirales phage]CAB4186316.1 hypothetical protein UFOVP1132_81 [uncultured Caudovirales phage]
MGQVALETTILEVEVQSSSDKDLKYTVRIGVDGTFTFCPCKGFLHRKTCKHVETARTLLPMRETIDNSSGAVRSVAHMASSLNTDTEWPRPPEDLKELDLESMLE